MEKLVRLKLEGDSLDRPLSVTLQMGTVAQPMQVELTGTLPPMPELAYTYQRWYNAYRRLARPYRLELRQEGFATNVSRVEDCHQVAAELSQQFNDWLASESFRPLQEKLLERLLPSDTVRIVVQTSLMIVQRLPWHSWNVCDRYPNAEIALSAPAYEQLDRPTVQRQQVRILAILGHSQHLDIATDQALLNRLPNADVQFLSEPTRQELNDALWQPEGWDILFFAGHSTSEMQSSPEISPETSAETTGKLYINPTDALTIPELKYALQKSLGRGLKIALFNSCDGLGLAHALADLHIPQVLVMREPVPDAVAHEFLKSFLASFSRGDSFYLAVREARQRLHGLEDRYPCATWLPIIYQNPAEQPPTWNCLYANSPDHASVISSQPLASSPVKPRAVQWPSIVMPGLLAIITVLGFRSLGWLESWEFMGLAQFMQLRSREPTDSRLLVIEITETDIQAQTQAQRQGKTLSDAALSQLLMILAPMEPRLIGLDIYRDSPVGDNHPQLAAQLQTTDNLMVVCKHNNIKHNNINHDDPGIAPPPEVVENHVGFSDVQEDQDRIVRRHLLGMEPHPASPCPSHYAFSSLLALAYLEQEGITLSSTDNDRWQLGGKSFQLLDRNFGGYHNVDARGHQILLNYRNLSSPTTVVESVTLGQVLGGQVQSEDIRDRIILIGSTSPTSNDSWPLPKSWSQPNPEPIPGVFLHAQFISQLLSAVLDDRPLIQSWSDLNEIIWIISWGGIGMMITYGNACSSTHHNKYWTLHSVSRFQLIVLATLISQLSLLGCCWLMFINSGYWLPWLPAAMALLLTTSPSLLPTQLNKQL